MRTVILLAVAASLAAGADFQWKGTLPAGKTIQIKGVNGKIQAEAAMTGEVEVTAVKTAKKSDPNSVTVQVVPYGDGVVICAMYPTPAGKPANECAADGSGRMSTDNNDTKVDFVVKVPAGVRLAASTVNGGISVHQLRSEVRVKTVNGSVDVSSSELVEAKTVNGSIDVSMGHGRLQDGLAFETVNGSVKVRMADGMNANLKGSTVNGNIRSDFPVTVRGKFGPRNLEGTIGSGGPELKIKTVNGNIELLKG